MAVKPLRHVETTRYVTPLREGGSLPAIVEANDLGHYVIKFRGAGQGIPVLIAELICGELGRALGLPVPELVLIDLDPVLANAEPDPEIQELLRASAGLNLGMDYLPGSIAFQPAKPRGVTPELASAIVWFDALIMNVDRTARNPNLLVWHDKLYLIDHGAALYVHHAWKDPERVAASRFPLIKDHVLLPFATEIERAAARLLPQITPELIDEVLALIPEEWLDIPASSFATVGEHLDAYRAFFAARLAGAEGFTGEAIDAATRAVEETAR
jgi:hypothetical protein